MGHDHEFGPITAAVAAPGDVGASGVRLDHRHAGLSHEPLELVLVSRMDPRTEHADDHERSPARLLLVPFRRTRRARSNVRRAANPSAAASTAAAGMS
jgi:hypothetical protein